MVHRVCAIRVYVLCYVYGDHVYVYVYVVSVVCGSDGVYDHYYIDGAI